MDIGFAFTFPFKDPNWIKKLLLIGVVGLIPIIGSIVQVGYLSQVIKNTLNNEATILPELDFGTQVGIGFKIFVVCLVYALPAIILQAPANIIQQIIIQQNNNNQNLVMAVSILVLCCSGIVILYDILLGFVLPIAITKVTLDESIGAGFKFNDIFATLKAGFLNYLIILLVAGFAGGLINMVGALVCLVGLFLTIPYVMAIQGNLYAQAYKATLAKYPA